MEKCRNIKIYSTLGCHLCDLAMAIVDHFAHSSRLDVEVIDIAEDDRLVEVYGTRIPVVLDTLSQAEISWPFDHEKFAEWCIALPPD